MGSGHMHKQCVTPPPIIFCVAGSNGWELGQIYLPCTYTESFCYVHSDEAARFLFAGSMSNCGSLQPTRNVWLSTDQEPNRCGQF